MSEEEGTYQFTVRMPRPLYKLLKDASESLDRKGKKRSRARMVLAALDLFRPKADDDFPPRPGQNQGRKDYQFKMPAALHARLGVISNDRDARGLPLEEYSMNAIVTEAVARYLYYYRNMLGLHDPSATGYSDQNPPPTSTLEQMQAIMQLPALKGQIERLHPGIGADKLVRRVISFQRHEEPIQDTLSRYLDERKPS